jgi:hypothetical protein
MDLTLDLFSADGTETLRFRTQPAHGAMFEGQYHSWAEHIEGDARSILPHSWQDTEVLAQARLDAQVKAAVKLGWLKVRPAQKSQQLGLF